MQQAKTIVHVTHEAAQKMGGIGAVLEGLHTCRSYQDAVHRSLILGPLLPGTPNGGLGSEIDIHYSSALGKTDHCSATALAEVEAKFGVTLVYGRRRFPSAPRQQDKHPEVLLVDVRGAALPPVNAFKAWLYEEFGIESNRYESDWDYEQYVQLAPAAVAALRAIGAADPSQPSILVAHEYMGMPTVLAALMDPLCAFKGVYLAHEVATARRIVESHPGHDTMFYNLMEWAHDRPYYLPELFGAQDFYFKHALLGAARFCDNIMAVSPLTRRELQFLSPQMERTPIDVAFNGLPRPERIGAAEKAASKARLQDYAENLLHFRPDTVFTHVTRMVRSKGLWRDLRLLWHIDQHYQQANRSGVLFLLSTDAPQRSTQTVRQNEQQWQWPVAHREKGSDLTEGEAQFYTCIQQFNARSRNVKVVFINQFGWDRTTCGLQMPEDMDFADLRRGADVELSQSIYEPFGIAPLEVLPYGGLCVLSSACGCLDLIRALAGPTLPANFVIADYTRIPHAWRNRRDLLRIDQAARDAIEDEVCRAVAGVLVQRLAEGPSACQQRLDIGYDLTSRMTWDVVCQRYFLPALDQAYYRHRNRRIA